MNGGRDLSRFKIVLPGAITSISILCGLFALILTYNDALIAKHGGWLVVSCWLIIFAAVIDGVDGKIARLTNSSSEFGIQFDSIADVITFGMASTIVLYRQMIKGAVAINPAYYIVPVAFLLAGAVRLARFNVTASTEGKKCFYGLPIPTAAGSVMALFLFFHALEGDISATLIERGFISTGIVISDHIKLKTTVVFTLFVSMLMVSTVRYGVSGDFFFGRIIQNKIRSLINLAILVFCVFVNAGAAFFLMSLFYIFYHIFMIPFNKTDTQANVSIKS